MRNIPLYLISCLLLLGSCWKSDQQKMIDEVEGAFGNISDDKVNEAKYFYTRFYEKKIERELKADQFARVDSLHKVASRFYFLVDSVNKVHFYDRQYPVAQVTEAYDWTLKLMATYAPEPAYAPRGYSQMREEPGAWRLLLGLMAIDIARAEIAILEKLEERYDVGAIRDDFRSAPYTSTLGSSAHQVSFTVKFKYLQKFPSREILVDSVLLNGRKVETPAIIDQDDILAVVNFNSLKKGAYVVKGRVHAVTSGGIQGGPFDYRFEVK